MAEMVFRGPLLFVEDQSLYGQGISSVIGHS
jgi:hypothetical protein